MKNLNNVELRYGNYVDQMVAYIAPKHLNVVAGRGTRKTTGIIADRSQEVVYDMPRSVLGFAADTFVNAKDKVIPKLVEGWREYLGWREGIHYVLEDPPPSHFDIPYTPIMSYKNTISIFNGCIFKLGSLDQPSGLAGDSIQHLFGDEVKYFLKKVLDIINPALRGHAQVKHSTFWRGTTFTTDLPNLSKKNHDWILDKRELMDMERIKAAFYAGYTLNEINHKIKSAIDQRNTGLIKKYKAQRERWMLKWRTARKDTTFFMMVSSLVNLDILENGYIYDQLDTLGWEEFKQSVLTFKSKLEEGERFYVGLGEHHYYDDGIDNKIAMSTGFQDHKRDCTVLRYWDAHAPLDIGVDFGKMISMVVAQEQGKYYRCLKNHYTLIPESSKELGKKFRDFWGPHQNRRVNMYYDRSGNQYESSGRDWATEVKNHIEFDEHGARTGWHVELMSREQGNIRQSQEHFFIKQVLQESTKGLPILLIDQYQCRELKSSLELSKIAIGVETRTGIRYIKKDKTSESLPVNKLPLHSTNMSDAFKYLMYRKKWTQKVKFEREYLPTGLDGVVG